MIDLQWQTAAMAHPAWKLYASALSECKPVDNDTAEKFWAFFVEGWHARNEVWSAMDRQEGGGDHYDLPIQQIEFCQVNGLHACESHAIKYIVRHAEKNGKEDILKAIHCLEMLMEIDYREDND